MRQKLVVSIPIIDYHTLRLTEAHIGLNRHNDPWTKESANLTLHSVTEMLQSRSLRLRFIGGELSSNQHTDHQTLDQLDPTTITLGQVIALGKLFLLNKCDPTNFDEMATLLSP